MSLTIDHLGIPYATSYDLLEEMYAGNCEVIDSVFFERNHDNVEFAKNLEEFENKQVRFYATPNISSEDLDQACQSCWLVDPKYADIDIRSHVLQCLDAVAEHSKYDLQLQRVNQELEAFEKAGMADTIRYLIFLVDKMHQENVVWGVGRGSSVSSYVLFLIGVHKVDSFFYDLDWKDFLKD